VVPALLIFIPFGPSPKRQGLIIRIKTKGRDSSLAVFILILPLLLPPLLLTLQKAKAKVKTSKGNRE